MAKIKILKEKWTQNASRERYLWVHAKVGTKLYMGPLIYEGGLGQNLRQRALAILEKFVEADKIGHYNAKQVSRYLNIEYFAMEKIQAATTKEEADFALAKYAELKEEYSKFINPPKQ